MSAARNEWLDYEHCGLNAGVYLLIFGDAIVYVGQTGDLDTRIDWHAQYKRFDRVRVLPVTGGARERCFVERHVRELVGPTFYPSGESVRDQIEMRRKGEPVDVEVLSGTGQIAGIVAFLRWGLA